jgi:hypothetical protein
LVVNPMAKHKYLGSEDDTHSSMKSALQVYNEAKTCGELSEFHYRMIDRFIDGDTIGKMSTSLFEPE